MENEKVVLELVGIDGNAYALMGAFSGAARRQGWKKEAIDKVMADCQSGDYDNLLRVLIANTTTEGLEETDEEDE